MTPINILTAQINPKVGAIAANAEKIINLIKANQATHDVILFPELVLSGYPPEDLVFRKEFHKLIEQKLNEIAAVTTDCYVALGHPALEGNFCFNAASVFYQGRCLRTYHKQALPTYGVFDEARYFTPGEAKPCILEIKGYRFGLCICEDIWQEAAINQMLDAKLDGVFCINASPFDYNKQVLRETLLHKHAKKGLAIIYVNQVGGQDSLLFDGQSMAFDTKGKLSMRAAPFKEELQTIHMKGSNLEGLIKPLLSQEQLIYEALVCGTHDYVEKNGFPGVLLGLSGGIDSALTLAIAVDALGPSRVQAVMMPSRYTAAISIEDAQQQLNKMGVKGITLPIEPAFSSLLDTLAPVFAGLKADTTEENIQARIRGLLLMALSNKTGNLVLTTSNKSETAVGYATLYGDMAGGFSVLKDVLKTQVYTLAHYRNQVTSVIPERVLTRPPSAELAANQSDQDNLPSYEIIDGIIKAYMEKNCSPTEIFEQGYPKEDIKKILGLIKRNEYKRRQAAPGIKISQQAFDRDWRYPITSGFFSEV